MSQSLAQKVAALPEEERESVLSNLDPDQLKWDADFWLRPEQIPSAGAWSVCLALAGRGWGKSRAGAEWIRRKAKEDPGCRISLVGRTSADTNNVMIHGESGIMSVCPESERPEHQISKRRLVFPNGTIAETYSAESPDQLRGPQAHFAWCDEFAAWPALPDASGLTAWDNVRLSTRLGANPQIFATTTPKRTPALQKMLDEFEEAPQRIEILRGSTYENAGNLSTAYLDAITGVYAGSALAQQELMGLMLEDSEGALWNEETLDASRVSGSAAPALPLRVVSVDPSVAENPRDECGIVVVGSTRERELYRRHAYVLEDASVLGAPSVWTRRVVEVARKWRAPVLAETNQGSALVADAIHNIDPSIPVYGVTASVGKRLRAEPVVLPYEQKRVHHWNYFPELESQMTTWDPEVTKGSPDRLDALVHGLTALLIRPPKGMGGGQIRTVNMSTRSIAGIRPKGRART